MGYILYKHTTPSNKLYIGITSNSVERRWSNGREYKNNPHFYNAILKYGWENIKHEILLTGLTKEKAEWWEKRLIKKYNSTDPKYGYNISLGGNAQGKHSKKTKERISMAAKGRSLSTQWRRNISKGLQGHEVSNLTREKIGLSNSNPSKKVREHYRRGRNSWKVYSGIQCIETGKVYQTIREAMKDNHVGQRNIIRDCTGVPSRKLDRLHWRYIYD